MTSLSPSATTPTKSSATPFRDCTGRFPTRRQSIPTPPSSAPTPSSTAASTTAPTSTHQQREHCDHTHLKHPQYRHHSRAPHRRYAARRGVHGHLRNRNHRTIPSLFLRPARTAGGGHQVPTTDGRAIRQTTTTRRCECGRAASRRQAHRAVLVHPQPDGLRWPSDSLMLSPATVPSRGRADPNPDTRSTPPPSPPWPNEASTSPATSPNLGPTKPSAPPTS